MGFPTARQEDWRFTSVKPITEQPFAVAGPAGHGAPVDMEPFRFPGPTAAELVFVDGYHAPDLSSANGLPEGTRIESLAQPADGGDRWLGRVASPEGRPFVALNTAFLADGARIEIPAGLHVERPIHLLFVATGEAGGRPAMSHPRVLLVLGAGSRATVVESHAGPSGVRYFANTVSEIVLSDGAVLDHCTVQGHGEEACHVGAVYARTARRTRLGLHTVGLGALLSRHDVTAVLDGEGTECALNGFYLADGRRLADHHTTIDHARPHCASRETYAGILAGRARGVFNGRIIVRADAQRTDARQMNRALLLSEEAQVNTNPQLEILADDVKCTHGAAVGQIDDEALFYLRTRGVAEAEARRLLIGAFAAAVLRLVPEGVHRQVEEAVARRIAGALRAAA